MVGGRQEAGEGGEGEERQDGGRKVRRRRRRSWEFHQFRSQRERERERERWRGSAVRVLTGSEFGEAAKKMGKVALRDSRSSTPSRRRRRQFLKGNLESAHVSFLFLSRRPDVKTEFVTAGSNFHSQKRRLPSRPRVIASSLLRAAGEQSSSDRGSLVSLVCRAKRSEIDDPLRAGFTAPRQDGKKELIFPYFTDFGRERSQSLLPPPSPPPSLLGQVATVNQKPATLTCWSWTTRRMDG